MRELGKKYKSENTRELILKGFVVYWLQEDDKQVKIKAEDVEGTVEPTDVLPDPEKPKPPPVEAVEAEIPIEEPTTREGQGKRRSHFHTMYAPTSNSSVDTSASNATVDTKSSLYHGHQR